MAGAPWTDDGGNAFQGVVITYLSFTCSPANTISGFVGALTLGRGNHCLSGAAVNGRLTAHCS